MKRPLSNIRPIGPLAQRNKDAEVNIFFEFSNLAPKTIDEVEEAITGVPNIKGPATGPVGVKDNVVSIQTSGNTITLSSIEELIDQVELETGIDVSDVEVIW